MNNTFDAGIILNNNNDSANLHCSKDALTNFFGWFLQGILAGLAFTCLIGKFFFVIIINHYKLIFIKNVRNFRK